MNDVLKKFFWSWSNGAFIGFQNGFNLFLKNGRPLGFFKGDELYDFSGHYLGEIIMSEYLIINKSKLKKTIAPKCRPCGVSGCSCGGRCGHSMISGFVSFMPIK